jgi:hypothetical protein
MTYPTLPAPAAARILFVLFVAAMLCMPDAAPGDDPADPPEEPSDPPSAEYIEYRNLPELGQITISDGVVRGAKAVARLEARAAQLAKRGIFGCTDTDKPHVYRRTDELDGRRIETTLVINPPADEESDWTRHVTVRVDGRKKVDCSIGYSSDGDVFISGVTIFPEDGTVDVIASDAQGSPLVPPEEFEKLEDPGVITDETLQPPPDDEAPEKPMTEKA